MKHVPRKTGAAAVVVVAVAATVAAAVAVAATVAAVAVVVAVIATSDVNGNHQVPLTAMRWAGPSFFGAGLRAAKLNTPGEEYHPCTSFDCLPSSSCSSALLRAP